MVVLLWFCLLAAAAIAYNVVWFPRTGLGAYYHDAATIPPGCRSRWGKSSTSP